MPISDTVRLGGFMSIRPHMMNIHGRAVEAHARMGAPLAANGGKALAVTPKNAMERL